MKVVACIAALVLAGCGAEAGPQGKSSSTVAPLEKISLGSPEALAFGPDGELYVSSCADGHVIRVGASGRLALVAGIGGVGDSAGDGGPATKAQFGCPAGIAFDGEGRLFITDHLGNRIRMVDETGTISTVVGSGPIGYNNGDLAGDGGPALDAHLNEPIAIGFDAQDRLYIGDRDNARIRRVGTDGVISTIAGTRRGFSGDGGPASRARIADPYYFVLARGRMFFCDNGNGRIRAIDSHGTISTLVAGLREPFGLALGPNGSLYVSVADNKVLMVDSAGRTSLVAGSGKTGFSGDGGPATQAALYGPAGLAFDGDGNLYIADSGNDRVRRVGLDGTITTVAGP